MLDGASLPELPPELAGSVPSEALGQEIGKSLSRTDEKFAGLRDSRLALGPDGSVGVLVGETREMLGLKRRICGALVAMGSAPKVIGKVAVGKRHDQKWESTTQ
jgi:hypothetical protein